MTLYKYTGDYKLRSRLENIDSILLSIKKQAQVDKYVKILEKITALTIVTIFISLIIV